MGREADNGVKSGEKGWGQTGDGEVMRTGVVATRGGNKCAQRWLLPRTYVIMRAVNAMFMVMNGSAVRNTSTCPTWKTSSGISSSALNAVTAGGVIYKSANKYKMYCEYLSRPPAHSFSVRF